MSASVRRIDQARRAADRVRRAMGDEIRVARLQAGLSQADVARAAGLSKGEVGRIERAAASWLTIEAACRVAAPLGLDVSVRLYPGGPPIRDAAQQALLRRLRSELPAVLRWSIEVPIPLPADRRAWDAMILGPGWRCAVEAETRLHDLQALERRIALKRRDDDDVPVLLLVNDTRINRLVLRTERESLRPIFPLDSRPALAALREGRFPGAGAIVVL
jgi:transcriptional regulator with XRE-family HTH domain